VMKVYMYLAAHYCEDCGKGLCSQLVHPVPDHRFDETYWDSDEYPKGPFENGEAGYPDHCDSCGIFLENPLTNDGVEYVLGMLITAEERGSPYPVHIIDWADQYRHYEKLRDVCDRILAEV